MLNTLRRPLSSSLKSSSKARSIPPRSLSQSLPRYASSAPRWVPPTTKENVDDDKSRQQFFNGDERAVKVPPTSPTFYTARSEYYDQLQSLETAIHFSRRSLIDLELFPLPDFARASLPAPRTAWRNREDMREVFNSKLTTGRYRRVTKLLNELEEFQRIAETAGHGELGAKILDVLQMFERKDKNQYLEQAKKRKQKNSVRFDGHGRSLTVGKRKTSSARVWMIPVQRQTPGAGVEEVQEKVEVEEKEAYERAFEAESAIEDPLAPVETPKEKVQVTMSTILVNNLPLNEYFRKPHEREAVVRPLKLAGVLGAFNVFAVTSGGGTSGQAGAVAHGIARGVVAHVPEVELTLRKAKLLRRDPRMVERKKPGRAKARKGYTWVKR